MGFHIPIEIAIGVTALSLFPASLISTYWNVRKKTVDFKLMWALEIPTMIGAILGAHLTSLFPGRPLEIIFSLFLVILSYRMINPSLSQNAWTRMITTLNSKKPLIEKKDYKVSLWASSLFGGFSGVIAGLFGIGGGILKTPIMIHIFKVPVRIAVATALCMIVFTSLVSGLTHAYLGHVNFHLLLSCGGGFMVGALFGGKISVKMADPSLKKTIAVLILMAGIATLIHSIFQ